MIDNGGTIVPTAPAAILAGKPTTLSSIYDQATIIDRRCNNGGVASPGYSHIRFLDNCSSGPTAIPSDTTTITTIGTTTYGNIININNNNNHLTKNFNAAMSGCAKRNHCNGTTTTSSSGSSPIPAIIIAARIFGNTDIASSTSLPASWHCNCAGGNYQETMPKDIPPPSSNGNVKGRKKYAAEFPTLQQEDVALQQNAPKQNKVKPRQVQRSRFKTMPITLEEFREADEELYMKQQQTQDAEKKKDDCDDDAFSDDLERPVGKFRQKSWTFTMGTGATYNRRSPSPHRKLSVTSSPRMLTNLHITPNSRTLNWRPLSQDSLLNLNNLSTLPTIPEERRMLNSPLTPSFETPAATAQFGHNETPEVKGQTQ